MITGERYLGEENKGFNCPAF